MHKKATIMQQKLALHYLSIHQAYTDGFKYSFRLIIMCSRSEGAKREN